MVMNIMSKTLIFLQKELGYVDNVVKEMIKKVD